MKASQYTQIAFVAAVIATIMILIGVFVLQGIVTPTESLRYNLVSNMFSNPEWLAFHFRAWLWLFVSAAASGLIAVKITNGRSNAHNK